jgi:peptidoglycan/xylan/chitin deacetylase (PgdA/CDA1 family)
MSWSDLRRLAEEGIRFGTHGLDHRPLSSLSPEEMLDQGARSRQILQERLGRAVDAIAYPFGDNDALVQRLMTECGYRFGFTTEPACSQLSSHLMALSRVEITGYDDLDHFVAKLGNACAYNALRTLRNGLFDGIDVLRRLT